MTDAGTKPETNEAMTTAEVWLWWTFVVAAIATLASASTLIAGLGELTSSPLAAFVLLLVFGGISLMTFIPAVILAGLRQFLPRLRR